MSALLPMTGAVLAGGASRRMGRDKAFIELGGRPLIARQLERLRGIFARVLVCANDAAPFARFGAPVVPDEGRPGGGPLGGIVAALRAAETPAVFCCAVDMPFLSEPLIRTMAALAPEFDVVIPRGDPDAPGRKTPLEPLHAFYAKSALEPLAARLATGERKLDRAMEGLRLRVIEAEEAFPYDPERRSFWNANTPDELEAARRALEGAR